MKKVKFRRKKAAIIAMVMLLAYVLSGCTGLQKQAAEEEPVQNESSKDVIITEAGEVLDKEAEPTPEEKSEPTPFPTPEVVELSQGAIDVPVPVQADEEVDEEEYDPNSLQIAFLGDSILDSARDASGIPYLVGQACNAQVYNLSIGGTSASMEEGESMNYDEWSSRSLVGIALMLNGQVGTKAIEGTRALEAMEKIENVGDIDYFVVEYGINDFLRIVPLSNPEENSEYDTRTYVGALRLAVEQLREAAPNAEIILCSPHYVQFFHDGAMVGDGNVLNNGYGTMYDYKGTCEYVSNQKGTMFLNAYQDLGIDGYTAEEYLEDGIHLTSAGRKLYADFLADKILKYEESRNN